MTCLILIKQPNFIDERHQKGAQKPIVGRFVHKFPTFLLQADSATLMHPMSLDVYIVSCKLDCRE